jgi:hypothetical protein
VRKSQWSDAAITGWVGVEQGQVEGSPDLHNAAVAAGQQVLAVSGHQNALKTNLKQNALKTQLKPNAYDLLRDKNSKCTENIFKSECLRFIHCNNGWQYFHRKEND